MCINKTILFSSIESRVCIELASVCLIFGYLVPMKKKIFGKRSYTHGTSCTYVYRVYVKFFNEISQFLSHFQILFFLFVEFFFPSSLFVFHRHHSALGGYYNINKTPYENQVLKPFLFFCCCCCNDEIVNVFDILIPYLIYNIYKYTV